MPVSNDIFRVFEVDKSTPIARYLDYSKFLSLLYMESLFFCRLDKFEDKYEGKIPVFNLELRWNYWLLYNEQLRSQGKQELTSNEIQEKVSQQYAHDEKMRSNICVSCWNLFEKESAALWKIYSDSAKGILIKSTVDRLTQSLKAVPEQVAISAVKYLNHQKEFSPDGNSIYPAIHKDHAYSYEEEIRVVHFVETNSDWKHDWNNENNESGIYIKIDPRILIEEIILGPTAPNWSLDIIKDISSKYDIHVKVRKSYL